MAWTWSSLKSERRAEGKGDFHVTPWTNRLAVSKSDSVQFLRSLLGEETELVFSLHNGISVSLTRCSFYCTLSNNFFPTRITMASSGPKSSHEPKIIQWLLDTRPLWPVTKRSKPREEVELLRTVVRPLHSPSNSILQISGLTSPLPPHALRASLRPALLPHQRCQNEPRLASPKAPNNNQIFWYRLMERKCHFT